MSIISRTSMSLTAASAILAAFGAVQPPALASPADATIARPAVTAAAAGTVSTTSPRHTMVKWANSELSNASHNHGATQNGVYNCNYYTGHYNGHQNGCQSGWHGGDWCADFVHYIWQLTGGVSDLSKINGYAQSFKTYGVNHGTWHTSGSSYTPKPGDAIVYPDKNGNGLADHVGIVIAASGNSVTTIEGNTGSMATHKYTVNKHSAQGFASPVIPQPAGSITNNSNLGLGVIHLADDSYAHGTYDVALPAHQDTYHAFHWAGAAGVYVGRGYKAHVYLKVGSSQTLVAELGSNKNLFLPRGGNFVVVSYRA